MSEPASYGYNNNQQSVCPRHPDQVTYVRCGRCGRLACGKCQIPLEVGMMCVDCRQQVRAAQPANRTPRSKPVVTYALIALNVLVWALQWVFPSVSTVGLYNPAWVEYSGEWYRALTSGFLHSLGNLSHLPLNMFSLYLFGQALEPILGRWKFLSTYLLSILGGSAAVHLIARFWGDYGDMTTSVLGASGGVFGLFGAFFALARARRQSTSGIMVLVAINFVYGLMFPGVSWEAHLGGLVTGAIVATLLNGLPEPRKRK